MKTISKFLLASMVSLFVGAVSAQTFTTIRNFGVTTNVSGFNPYARLVQAPDGTLYGTTGSGEGNVKGTIYKMQPDGSGFAALRWFTNTLEGANPSSLTLSGDLLYGTTSGGGSSNKGTVFKMNTDGTAYTVLKHFTGSDGANPSAGVTLSGSLLYGTTYYGGSSNWGTVFKVNTDGTGYTVLRHCVSEAYPAASVTLSGNVLYVTMYLGGVFKMNTDGTGFTTILGGSSYYSGVTLSGNVLYGTTYYWGRTGGGTVFRVNTDGTDYTMLVDFSNLGGPGDFGKHPRADLTLLGDVLYGTTDYDSGGVLFKVNTNGAGFTVLQNFPGNLTGPVVGLISDGVLYGTTRYSSPSVRGTVFKMNTNGTGFTDLKKFSFSDGYPAGLTVSGSVLYGTTRQGGSLGNGTVFKVNTDGTGHYVLQSFTGSDGANPYASLTLSGNVLYGTTYYGGNSNYTTVYGSGTVFKMNTDGTDFTVLKRFAGSDGANPYARLTLSGNVLYGTTYNGGSSGYGTAFRMNTDGTGFTVLRNFSGSDGYNPRASLALSGNVLYGTTQAGGSLATGLVFKMNTDGTGFAVLRGFYYSTESINPYTGVTVSGNVLYGTTHNIGGTSDHGSVFRMNTDGTGFTVLHDFYSDVEGTGPSSDLILLGNMLYGTTDQGGNSDCGTVFRVNTNGGGFAVLKHFNATDGSNPQGGLALSGNVFYGTTLYGGELSNGTAFALSMPFPAINSQPSGIVLPCGVESTNLSVQASGEAPLYYPCIPRLLVISLDYPPCESNSAGHGIGIDASRASNTARGSGLATELDR